MFGIIYKITNKLSGKAYVGQTTQSLRKRWNSHVAQSEKCRWPVHRAIAKYGRNAFDVVVLERCADRESLDAAERKWVESERTKQPRGYNLTDGGGGISGFKMPAEACQKLGDRMRGREVSPETRAKIAAANRGRVHSAEHVAARVAHLRGQQRTEDTRRKISNAHKGKTLTPEHIAKSAEARRGQSRPSERRRTLSADPFLRAGRSSRASRPPRASLGSLQPRYATESRTELTATLQSPRCANGGNVRSIRLNGFVRLGAAR